MIDILVIGNDFSAYTAAYELSKRGFSVSHNTPFKHYFIDQFNSPQKLPACDVDQYYLGDHETLQSFIHELGLKKTKLDYPSYKEILSDGRNLTRHFDKKAFKIYVYRHFAKEHLSLDKWFKDIETMYVAFKDFQTKRQKNLTAQPSLLFEKIKSLNLKEWLDSYFKLESLKDSLNVFYKHEGASLDQINTYDYLIHWFYLFEEKAAPLRMSYKDLIQTIQKHIDPSIFLDQPIKDIQFKKNHYLVTMNDGTKFETKYILGTQNHKNTQPLTYRWIDLDIDLNFYNHHFKEKIIYKETPLFKHLSVQPLHLLNSSKEGYLRIEAISEASAELLINFVSRYFPNLESNIKSSTQRIPQHLNASDFYDRFVSISGFESLGDLFEKPKWIEVNLNTEFKPLLPFELNKGLLYANVIEYFLNEEKNPDDDSIIRTLVNPFVLKFEPHKNVDFNLQIGLREFYLTSIENGVRIQKNKAKKTVIIKEEGFKKWLYDKSLLNGDIINEAGNKSDLLEGIISQKDTFKNPYGLMVILAIVAMSLLPLIFSSLPFWLVPGILLTGTVSFYLATKLISYLGLLYTLLSLVFLMVPFFDGFYGFTFIIGGVVIFISTQIEIKSVSALHKDPIRNQLSDYYFNKFNKRVTRCLSFSLSIIGLISLLNSLPLLFGTLAISFSLITVCYFMNLDHLIEVKEVSS